MLRNDTRRNVLSSRREICSTLMSRTIGLMFSSKKRVLDNSLVFVCSKEARWDLHMMFVFYPIDVLFLDARKKVVEIKENFLPFTYYMPEQKSRYIIELKKGVVVDSGTQVGDVISW